jgi:hypothetical protein
VACAQNHTQTGGFPQLKLSQGSELAPGIDAGIVGHGDEMLKLQEVAAETKNEIRLMHVPKQTLIAAMNTPTH